MSTLNNRLKQFIKKIIAVCACTRASPKENVFVNERSKYEDLVLNEHLPLDLAVTSLIHDLLKTGTEFRDLILKAVNNSTTHLLLETDVDVKESLDQMIFYFGLNNWDSVGNERKIEFLKEYKEILVAFKKNIQQNLVFDRFIGSV